MRGWFVSCILTGLSGPALAGPWTLPDGAAYVRTSVAREDVETLRAWRGDAYGEYGLTDDWTASLKIESVLFEGAADYNSDGIRATLRRRGFRNDYFTTSLEVGVLAGAAIGGAQGCDSPGGELRVGIGGSVDGTPVDPFIPANSNTGFVLLEVAGRAHADGCQTGRIEFGYGEEILPSVWTITQVWIERGNTNSPSDKIQFGVRQEFGGAFEEDGMFIALARRF